MGIVRNETDLGHGLSEILAISEQARRAHAEGPRAYNQSWFDSIQVGNMVLDCEIMLRSAMARKESRGAHTRSDFPKKDNENWLVNIISKEKDGNVVQELVPVLRPPPELAALIKE
jgi:succinate dehydrogenase / fumarate reductase, flavoprotein subunit